MAARSSAVPCTYQFYRLHLLKCAIYLLINFGEAEMRSRCRDTSVY